MEVVQILYDYISQKEQEKSTLLVQLKQYIEDIKEVIEIHNILHDNCLQSYPYNTQSLSEECNIFWIPFEKKNSLRMVLPDEHAGTFIIDNEGNYGIVKADRHIIKESLEVENKYLSMFCKWFPKYRDNVFEFVKNNFKTN